jgi:hypothetical protein
MFFTKNNMKKIFAYLPPRPPAWLWLLLLIWVVLKAESYIATMYEAKKIHATQSLGPGLYDTANAKVWNYEIRAFDGNLYYYNPTTTYWTVVGTGSFVADTLANDPTYDTLLTNPSTKRFVWKSLSLTGVTGAGVNVSKTTAAGTIAWVLSGAWTINRADSTSTSNATPATLTTYTIPDNSVGVIEVTMSAAETDASAGITGKKIVRYRKAGGTITLGSITSILADEVDAGASGATWTIDDASNNVIIQVTGVAATSIEWKVVATLTIKIPTPP